MPGPHRGGRARAFRCTRRFGDRIRGLENRRCNLPGVRRHLFDSFFAFPGEGCVRCCARARHGSRGVCTGLLYERAESEGCSVLPGFFAAVH